MKKILSVTLFSDPRCQGGVETFNRVLKSFYLDKISILTQANRNKKIYEVSNLIEIGSNNFFFKLINKILQNKIREFMILKEIRKIKEKKIIIFSYPYEIELLKNIQAKKILVQHTNFEHFIRSYCQNKEKYIKIIKTVDILVILSPYDVKKFQEKFELEKDKIRVIRHSSTIPMLKEKKQKNKKLIMVGRIDNNSKRFDLAIKAMKKLPEYTLDIYGDIYIDRKQDYEILKELIKTEKIENVAFKGATNKVQEKLDESGIFIMTSDYEAYGIVNIEAMRRGLPIVLRNTFDSAPDIIVDNTNGILLDKEWDENKFVEAVKKIYDNYEYYSENSKKLGERHSPEVIKREWDKLFEELGENNI